MIRVLIADEMRLTATLLASVLQNEADIEITGWSITLDEAIRQVNFCDVVLVNMNLSHTHVLELIQALFRTKPHVKIIVVGVPRSECLILKYLKAGAAGYVLKEDGISKLLKSIRYAFSGTSALSPGVTALLMSRAAYLITLSDNNALKETEESVELTAYERKILGLVGQGLNNQDIARRLTIEPEAVKGHVHHIFKKLNVTSWQEVAAYLPSHCWQ